MTERKVFTGDAIRAAGYLPFARRLLGTCMTLGLPVLRRSLPDGTEISVSPHSRGNEINIYCRPEQGELFLADTGGHRIVVFSQQGLPLRTFGTEGIGGGEFTFPRDVKVYGNRVYVSDQGNSRVQIFSRKGEFISAHWLGYSVADISISGNRIAVSKTNNPVGFAVYDLEFNLIYDKFIDPGFNPLAPFFDAPIPSSDDGFYNELTAITTTADRVFVSGNIVNGALNYVRCTKMFDLATGAYISTTFPHFDTTTEYMKAFRGKLYALELTLPTYPHVRIYAIEPNSLVYESGFGYFGPADYSQMTPAEFYRLNNPTFNFGSRALAVNANGVFVVECGKVPTTPAPPTYALDSDRVKHFTLAGVHVRNFGATGAGPGQFQRCFGADIG